MKLHRIIERRKPGKHAAAPRKSARKSRGRPAPRTPQSMTAVALALAMAGAGGGLFAANGAEAQTVLNYDTNGANGTHPGSYGGDGHVPAPASVTNTTGGAAYTAAVGGAGGAGGNGAANGTNSYNGGKGGDGAGLVSGPSGHYATSKAYGAGTTGGARAIVNGGYGGAGGNGFVTIGNTVLSSGGNGGNGGAGQDGVTALHVNSKPGAGAYAYGVAGGGRGG
ncbi:MAG: hypothetical protein JO255_19230, partial [Alphaproteobacteria bacterium]|nr:hypothetical protein [Alphaproteobacteria bacterium]